MVLPLLRLLRSLWLLRLSRTIRLLRLSRTIRLLRLSRTIRLLRLDLFLGLDSYLDSGFARGPIGVRHPVGSAHVANEVLGRGEGDLAVINAPGSLIDGGRTDDADLNVLVVASDVDRGLRPLLDLCGLVLSDDALVLLVPLSLIARSGIILVPISPLIRGGSGVLLVFGAAFRCSVIGSARFVLTDIPILPAVLLGAALWPPGRFGVPIVVLRGVLLGIFFPVLGAAGPLPLVLLVLVRSVVRRRGDRTFCFGSGRLLRVGHGGKCCGRNGNCGKGDCTSFTPNR